ncbi:unnamed protein product [Psylliodes chrysocephalus]|uniref:PHD-type domain-containing protein n=1 Tax=Psylliodes chrysocephalus TaxID=3402493 RepID=A0A9P0GDR7_9CUCU|nr:unnamed protein product [Psylliodes chrysocephala]
MPGEFDHEPVQSEDEFDTQLLCPDVIIEEKNGSIVTTNDDNAESVGSPLDYNIMGIKARFNLNIREELLRCEIYKPSYPIQKSRLHCTACNTHLGSALNCANNVFVHPLLAVLVCNECFEYYTAGGFEKDDDGAEMYCRWCGQGGQVFCCSKCPMVFCKLCVRINFTTVQYSAIRDSDYWECFSCNPSQIMHLKVQCYEFVKYVTSETVRIKNGPQSEFYMSIDYSQCCLNASRKKRSKRQDPDFVPYVEGAVDKIKRSKLQKREDIPQCIVKNLVEPADAQNYLNMLTPPIINGPKITSTPSTTYQVPIPIPKPKENLPMPAVYTTPTSHYSTPPLLQNLNIANYQYCNQNVPKTIPVTSSTPTIRPILPKTSPHMSLHFPQNQLRFPPPIYTIRPPLPPLSTSINRPPLFRNTADGSTSNDTSSRMMSTSEFRQLIVKNSREMDKHLLSVALANSTFASTLLKIHQIFNEANNIEDVVVVYDTMQKSLKMMTESLMDVKIRINVGSRGGGVHRDGTGGNSACDVGNQTQGHSRLPVIKMSSGLPPSNYIPK